LLEYTPTTRFTPLEACAHKFFDELRDPNVRLPSGKELPPLFNFTQSGIYLIFNEPVAPYVGNDAGNRK
jgi:hypothetical protein